jgi:LacI family transcriptional regulator
MRAYHLAEACRSQGLQIPEDVAILGADDDELVCNFSDPPLSSIDQNAFGIGYAAAKTLESMLQNPDVVPSPVLIDPIRLIERESTRIYTVSPPWLSDALIFIRRNISNNITASDVYAAVGKSHTLVDSAFRRTFGTSVQKTIIRTRLEEAKRLIRDTSLTLTEISAKTGFSTAQYFCSSFSKTFGTSPSAYRSK